MDLGWQNQGSLAAQQVAQANSANAPSGAGVSEVWGVDENGDAVLRRTCFDGNAMLTEYFDHGGNVVVPSDFCPPLPVGQGYLHHVTYAQADGYPSVEYLHQNAAAVYPGVYADGGGVYWYAQPDGTLVDHNGVAPFFPSQGLFLLDDASGLDYTTLALCATGGDLGMTATGGSNSKVTIVRGAEGLELQRASQGWDTIVKMHNVGAQRSEGKTLSMIVKYAGTVTSMQGLVDVSFDYVTSSYKDMEIAAYQANNVAFDRTYGGGRQSASWNQQLSPVSSSTGWMKLEFVDTGSNGAVCRAVGVSGNGGDPFASSEEVDAAMTWTTNCPATAENVVFGLAPFRTNGNTMIIKAVKVS